MQLCSFVSLVVASPFESGINTGCPHSVTWGAVRMSEKHGESGLQMFAPPFSVVLLLNTSCVPLSTPTHKVLHRSSDVISYPASICCILRVLFAKRNEDSMWSAEPMFPSLIYPFLNVLVCHVFHHFTMTVQEHYHIYRLV